MKYFILSLILCSLAFTHLIQAQSEGEAKKIHKVYTNDTASIEGRTVRFLAFLEISDSRDKILITSSNKKVATVNKVEVSPQRDSHRHAARDGQYSHYYD